jgi:signal peptidase I
MSGYEWYVFFLCLIVFTLLTGLFSALMYYIIKSTLRMIEHGLEDERITTEYQKQQQEKPAVIWAYRIISTVLLVAFLGVAVVSTCMQLASDTVTGNAAVPKIVLSDSMSFQNEHNKYLSENNLNDQFNTFDIIYTRKLPDEFDLQLYDIVVYEYHDNLVVHRIVGIEEPNEHHPDCRHFLLQGDAVRYTDEFPVLYTQMRAIYTGERIPYVGSFFAFMQSPAGYLCVLLVIFAMVTTPIAEKKLETAKRERLIKIGVILPDVTEQAQERQAAEVH